MRMSPGIATTLLLATWTGCANLGQAAGATDEVVVTSARLEETLTQELARSGTRVESIESAVVGRGGYNDIAQTLQARAHGLYVAPRAGAFDYVDLSFQGSRTGDVLWLIDGVRLNNRLYNSTTPIDTIPAHVVERIELLEGGQGLFYGTQSIAGVVNIVTKELTEARSGAVSLATDSNAGRHLAGFFRDAFGAHQLALYASSDEADGFRPFRKQDLQPSARDRERGYEIRTVGAKHAYRFGKALRVSTLYQHSKAELDHAQPKLVASAVNERDEDILSVKADYSPAERLQLLVKGYYHRWDAHYTQWNTNPQSPAEPLLVSNSEFWGFEDYGLNLLAKSTAYDRLELFAGYDLQRYAGQDDVLLIARQTETVHAPFAQVRTTAALFPRVRLAAGVRHNSPDNGAAMTVWNASGMWSIAEHLFARGTIGTAFRLPDAYELFAIDPCCEAGNPNLEPEESANLNVSIGGSVALPALPMTWEAVAFFRDVTNLITVTFDPARGIDTFENVHDTVRVRGGEVLLGAGLRGGVSVKGSFTYTDSRRSSTRARLQDIPRTQLKVSLDYLPDGPFEASITLNRVGDLFRDLGVGRQEYGNYTVVDLAAHRSFGEDRRHRIGLRLENAFDEEYATRVRQTTPDSGGSPYAYWHVGTPRTWHARYTYRF